MNRGAELLKAASGTQGQKAKRLDVSQPFVSLLLAGRKIPGDELRRRIEAAYGVPIAAWDQRPAGEASEPPASSPRAAETAPGDLPNPGDGRSVVERARDLLAYLAVPGRTQIELAQAREIRAALTLEARLVGAMQSKGKLHEHPEFEAWADALIAALTPVPGALEALEGFLAPPADEGKAAA